jgi:hypothetical protein
MMQMQKKPSLPPATGGCQYSCGEDATMLLSQPGTDRALLIATSCRPGVLQNTGNTTHVKTYILLHAADQPVKNTPTDAITTHSRQMAA